MADEGGNLKLTPIDIKKQEFKKALRGFDPEEVKAYLEFVADEYEQMLQYNQQLEKQVSSYQKELRHYKDVEKTLKQTLHELQETSQISKQTSQKEAELIIREAEINAAKMIDEAKAEVEKMRKEITTLRQQRDSFVTRLRYLLSSQLELLDVLQTDDDRLDALKEKTQKLFKGSKRSVSAGAKNVKNAPAAQNATQPSRPIKSEPEIKMPQPEKQVTNKERKEGKAKKSTDRSKSKDFFKDIFGDDLDVDDIFKEKEK